MGKKTGKDTTFSLDGQITINGTKGNFPHKYKKRKNFCPRGRGEREEGKDSGS